jgi:plasmid maintenance system antidote protein VapI
MPRTADVIRYLMDQHGLSRADMVPILGTASRVSEVLSGKKELSMTMVQRLRARFGVSAEVLLLPVRATKARGRRSGRRRDDDVARMERSDIRVSRHEGPGFRSSGLRPLDQIGSSRCQVLSRVEA